MPDRLIWLMLLALMLAFLIAVAWFVNWYFDTKDRIPSACPVCVPNIRKRSTSMTCKNAYCDKHLMEIWRDIARKQARRIRALERAMDIVVTHGDELESVLVKTHT